MERLEATKITKSYGGKMILSDVALHLGEKEIVCLLGISGAGKTTLFNILSGLEQPEEGHVYLNSKEVTGKPGEISYMLQKDLLLPYRKVVDNVALPLVIRGIPKKEARKLASAHFKEFSIDGCEKKYPAQLSGGMRQRAALLRTYLSSNGVALLDEPFSALDTITKSTMHKWYLRVMQKIDLSTLFITHDIDEAIFLSDRIYILSGAPGKLTEEIVIDRHGEKKENFNLTPAFLAYKKQLLTALHLS